MLPRIECKDGNLYIYFQEPTPGIAVRTETLCDFCHVDYDKDGKLVGVEVLEVDSCLICTKDE